MRGAHRPRSPLPTYPVPDPSPPPPVPDSVRRELVQRRHLADDWQDPDRLRGALPALVAERRTQAEHLHAFASSIVQRREDWAHADRSELIALVHSVLRLTDTAFAAAFVEYARDFMFIERPDLDVPQGLQRTFNTSR